MSFSRKTSVKIGVEPEVTSDSDVSGEGFEHRICSPWRNDPRFALAQSELKQARQIADRQPVGRDIGSDWSAIGFGSWSRLLADSGSRRQFASMNLRIEMWSV